MDWSLLPRQHLAPAGASVRSSGAAAASLAWLAAVPAVAGSLRLPPAAAAPQTASGLPTTRLPWQAEMCALVGQLVHADVADSGVQEEQLPPAVAAELSQQQPAAGPRGEQLPPAVAAEPSQQLPAAEQQAEQQRQQQHEQALGSAAGAGALALATESHRGGSMHTAAAHTPAVPGAVASQHLQPPAAAQPQAAGARTAASPCTIAPSTKPAAERSCQQLQPPTTAATSDADFFLRLHKRRPQHETQPASSSAAADAFGATHCRSSAAKQARWDGGRGVAELVGAADAAATAAMASGPACAQGQQPTAPAAAALGAAAVASRGNAVPVELCEVLVELLGRLDSCRRAVASGMEAGAPATAPQASTLLGSCSACIASLQDGARQPASYSPQHAQHAAASRQGSVPAAPSAASTVLRGRVLCRHPTCWTWKLWSS